MLQQCCVHMKCKIVTLIQGEGKAAPAAHAKKPQDGGQWSASCPMHFTQREKSSHYVLANKNTIFTQR